MKTGITIILAIVLGVIGFLIGRSTRPPRAVPGDGTTLVHVGPRASQLDVDPVTLHKRQNDVLYWTSTEGNRNVRIEVEQEIFDGMKPLHGRFVVDCRERRCFSGNIKATVPEDPSHKYKYWQFLTDPDGRNEDSADGWIIINK